MPPPPPHLKRRHHLDSNSHPVDLSLSICLTLSTPLSLFPDSCLDSSFLFKLAYESLISLGKTPVNF